jgi:hypothetical protein
MPNKETKEAVGRVFEVHEVGTTKVPLYEIRDAFGVVVSARYRDISFILSKKGTQSKRWGSSELDDYDAPRLVVAKGERGEDIILVLGKKGNKEWFVEKSFENGPGDEAKELQEAIAAINVDIAFADGLAKIPVFKEGSPDDFKRYATALINLFAKHGQADKEGLRVDPNMVQEMLAMIAQGTLPDTMVHAIKRFSRDQHKKLVSERKKVKGERAVMVAREAKARAEQKQKGLKNNMSVTVRFNHTTKKTEIIARTRVKDSLKQYAEVVIGTVDEFGVVATHTVVYKKEKK